MSDCAANQLKNYQRSVRKTPDAITNSVGSPLGVKDAIQTVGPMGPPLLQDSAFLEEMAQFNRERVPERVVHAKGSGAYGYFEVTNSITQYCAAKLFSNNKKRTPVSVRFSTQIGESGSADTVRDIRGFAVKFHTEDGIWDLVGSNSPVFFIRDPMLYTSFIHSQKRNPITNLKDPNMIWDFLSLRPETTHQLCLLYSERGIPDGYRHMHGYGCHTYKLVNKQGESVFAKFHLKTEQGIRNLCPNRAVMLAGKDPDYAQRDLYNAIKKCNYPSWKLYIQVMTFEQACQFKYNPFDPTKTWPQTFYPLIPIGKLTLDKNPVNYFAEMEQLSFSPSHLVPGIEPSPDRMLQARLFAYTDSQFHRLGPNHAQIPVNCPYRVGVRNYQRDGLMAVTDNQDGAPNYYPNSFSGPEDCIYERDMQNCCPLRGDVYRFSNGDSQDNFKQATEFWVRTLNNEGRNRLVENITADLCKADDTIQERAVNNFLMVHAEFGRLLCEALHLAKVENMRKLML